MTPETFFKWMPWILSFILLSSLVASCEFSSFKEKQLNDNLKISRDSTHHFRDKHNQAVSENQSMQLTIRDLKSQSDQLGIDKKRIEDEVGALKNLVSYYKGKIGISGTANSVAHDTVFVAIKNGDTVRIKEKNFNWSNNYLSLHQTFNPQSDSMRTQYRYQTDFELTTYWRKKNPFLPFSKKTLYADARISDPNGSLTRGQSIVVQQPPKPLVEKPWFDVLVGFIIGIFVKK